MPEPQFSATPTGANPGIGAYVQNMVQGRQMKALSIKRQAVLQSLKANRSCQPATVLNFNPVALRMPPGGIVLKVPSVLDPSVRDDKKLSFTYQKRNYRATYVTIDEPKLAFPITDVVRSEGQDMGDGAGKYDVWVCKQIEMAHALWTDYNEGSQNSCNMGGCVIFQGNIHALKQQDGMLQVPTFVELPTRSREYFCEPRKLDDFLAQQLDRQRDYCEGQCQQAQIYHDDPADQRKNITTIHRLWGQYSLDMGFRTTPPDWLLYQDRDPETCEGCGAIKKKATAFFCHSCARPYSPFDAYMAGEIGVNHDAMVRIKPEQWPAIHKKEQERNRLRMGPQQQQPGGDKAEVNTLLDVKQKARALVGDPDGDFTTDAYLTPLINIAYEQGVLYLENTCSPMITKLVVLPNVPQGTTNFVPEAAPGNPLFGLVTPLKLEWKINGQPESFYVFAVEKSALPNVSPANYVPMREVCWEWRQSQIYLTPLGFNADFRLRGEFNPVPLVQDADDLGIDKRMALAVAYGAAALIGAERQNANYAQNYTAQAEKIFDDIAAAVLVRQQQGVVQRLGRISGGRRNGWWR